MRSANGVGGVEGVTHVLDFRGLKSMFIFVGQPIYVNNKERETRVASRCDKNSVKKSPRNRPGIMFN